MENIMTPEHTKLNMGCGFKKLNDHWNVDVESKCNPDEVLDFEVTPWPYEDNFLIKLMLIIFLNILGKIQKFLLTLSKKCIGLVKMVQNGS